jgi:hypothetical protein
MTKEESLRRRSATNESAVESPRVSGRSYRFLSCNKPVTSLGNGLDDFAPITVAQRFSKL